MFFSTFSSGRYGKFILKYQASVNTANFQNILTVIPPENTSKRNVSIYAMGKLSRSKFSVNPLLEKLIMENPPLNLNHHSHEKIINVAIKLIN